MSADLLGARSACRDLPTPRHWQTWPSFPSPCFRRQSDGRMASHRNEREGVGTPPLRLPGARSTGAYLLVSDGHARTAERCRGGVLSVRPRRPAMKRVTAAGLTPVGPLLQAFFIDYLYGQKRASVRTVESYRDTLRLLLQFLQRTTGKVPSALHTLDLDAPAILRFLDHLEGQRHNQAQSRNVRLAAVHSFFR